MNDSDLWAMLLARGTKRVKYNDASTVDAVRMQPRDIARNELRDLMSIDRASEFQQKQEGFQEIIVLHPKLAEEKWGRSGDERYPLHQVASLSSSVTIVKAVYKAYQGAITLADAEGWTPLHYACTNKESERIVQFLYEKSPQAIRQKTKKGSTPLHLACGNKQAKQVIRFLYDMYPETVKEKDSNGWTPLHVACLKQAKQVIRFLYDMYPEAVKEKDSNGWTPLHVACLNRQSKPVIRFLVLEYRQAVNEKDDDGKSPLDLARQTKASTGVINLLRVCMPLQDTHANEQSEHAVRSSNADNAGAGNEKDVDGNSPVDISQETNASAGVVDSSHPSHNASANEQFEEVIQSSDANNPEAVNEKDLCGNLPVEPEWNSDTGVADLFSSPGQASQGQQSGGQSEPTSETTQRDELRTLHSQGGVPSLPCKQPAVVRPYDAKTSTTTDTNSNDERSEEEQDVRKEFHDLMDNYSTFEFEQKQQRFQQIIEAYPQLAKEKWGWLERYPLHQAAACSSSLRTIQAVFFSWPDAIKEKSKDGYMPFHLACRYKQSEQVLRFLDEKYPEAVRMKTEVGETPLHLACFAEQSEQVIRLLLEKYPEAVNETDEYRKTPLAIARDIEAPQSIISLLMYPAQIQFRTPVDYARGKNSSSRAVATLDEAATLELKNSIRGTPHSQPMVARPLQCKQDEEGPPDDLTASTTRNDGDAFDFTTHADLQSVIRKCMTLIQRGNETLINSNRAIERTEASKVPISDLTDTEEWFHSLPVGLKEDDLRMFQSILVEFNRLNVASTINEYESELIELLKGQRASNEDVIEQQRIVQSESDYEFYLHLQWKLHSLIHASKCLACGLVRRSDSFRDDLISLVREHGFVEALEKIDFVKTASRGLRFVMRQFELFPWMNAAGDVVKFALEFRGAREEKLSVGRVALFATLVEVRGGPSGGLDFFVEQVARLMVRARSQCLLPQKGGGKQSRMMSVLLSMLGDISSSSAAQQGSKAAEEIHRIIMSPSKESMFSLACEDTKGSIPLHVALVGTLLKEVSVEELSSLERFSSDATDDSENVPLGNSSSFDRTSPNTVPDNDVKVGDVVTRQEVEALKKKIQRLESSVSSGGISVAGGNMAQVLLHKPPNDYQEKGEDQYERLIHHVTMLTSCVSELKEEKERDYRREITPEAERSRIISHYRDESSQKDFFRDNTKPIQEEEVAKLIQEQKDRKKNEEEAKRELFRLSQSTN